MKKHYAHTGQEYCYALQRLEVQPTSSFLPEKKNSTASQRDAHKPFASMPRMHRDDRSGGREGRRTIIDEAEERALVLDVQVVGPRIDDCGLEFVRLQSAHYLQVASCFLSRRSSTREARSDCAQLPAYKSDLLQFLHGLLL